MDSKFIKSHQCSLERSHVALTEINPEFCQHITLDPHTRLDLKYHPTQEISDKFTIT